MTLGGSGGSVGSMTERRYEVLVRAAHAATGKPESYLRGEWQRLLQKHDDGATAWANETLSESEAAKLFTITFEAFKKLGDDPAVLEYLDRAIPFAERLKQSGRLAEHLLHEEHANRSREARKASTPPLTKKRLGELAHGYWENSVAIYPNPLDVMLAVSAMHERAQDQYGRLFLSTEDGQMFGLGMAWWAECAFPVVHLASHRYAAALMSTAVTIDQAPMIKPPWRSFVIDVPPGLLATTDAEGRTHDVVHVSVAILPCIKDVTRPLEVRRLREDEVFEGWSWIAVTTGNVMLHSYRRPIEGICEGTVSTDDRGAFDMDPTDQDERTMFLITRLIANTCLAMSDPTQVQAAGKHPVGWTRGPLRGATEPVFRTYRVGKPIVVDCRPALKEFLLGHRRNPAAVQWLVRGHWRHQACGPGLADRKLTWIAPHWKGQADAPINVRPHVMQGQPDPERSDP